MYVYHTNTVMSSAGNRAMSILKTPSPSDVNTIKTRVIRAEHMNSEEEYRPIYSVIGTLPSHAADITMIDHSGDNNKITSCEPTPHQ